MEDFLYQHLITRTKTMQFTPININNWPRKEYFEHYHKNIPCTYSMTVKLDITQLKQQNKHLYSTLLFYLTQIINQHQEFRTCFNSKGQLGFFGYHQTPYYLLINKYNLFNPKISYFKKQLFFTQSYTSYLFNHIFTLLIYY